METKRRKRIEDMSPAERLAEAQRICDGSDCVMINGLRHRRIKGSVEDYAKLVGAMTLDEFCDRMLKGI